MNTHSPLPESVPAVFDYTEYLQTSWRGGRRVQRVQPIGRYCEPANCAHPVTARIWPTHRGYRAACHDCGASELRNGQWEIAL